MNTVRWQIVNELYAAFGKPFVTITYGAMTKEKRIALQLEKVTIMMHMRWVSFTQTTVVRLSIMKR